MTSDGIVRVWRPAGELAGDFLCVYLESGAGAAHLHEEWQFAVAEFPSAVSVGGFRRYAAHLGDVTVIPPYQVHSERQGAGPAGWRVLHVAASVMTRLYRAPPGKPSTSEPTFSGPVVESAAAAGELRTLLRGSEHGDMTEEFVPRVLVWLAKFLERHASESSSPPHTRSVERARTYLRERPTQAVSLPELVAVAGVSSSHLARSFSRLVGLPPRSFHAQVRLARARRLLSEGHAATRVAYECGFADQSHLNRRFKECYGLTPGAFQAQYLADRTATVQAKEMLTELDSDAA